MSKTVEVPSVHAIELDEKTAVVECLREISRRGCVYGLKLILDKDVQTGKWGVFDRENEPIALHSSLREAAFDFVSREGTEDVLSCLGYYSE